MIRVLHCPNLVGGNPHSLAKAERRAGMQSWHVALEPDPRGYTSDEFLWQPGTSIAVQYAKRAQLLIRALREYDVIHFNFGQTIFPRGVDASEATNGRYPRGALQSYRWLTRRLEMRDLAILRRAGKGIVVTYQGGDARQLDYCRERFAVTYAQYVEDGLYPSDSSIRRQVAHFARYAHRILALNPDLLWVLRKDAQFVPYANVNPFSWHVVPVDTDPAHIPVILHAPTQRAVKGTQFIINAVERLRSEGVALEFVLVENVTHSEAMEVYARADLLVDQLLAGWYGGLAVELMAMGKPVISYIREDDLVFIPPRMRAELPIINADPSSIYHILKKWLQCRTELRTRGLAGREFVDKWHDPEKIAAQMRSLYESVLIEARNG